MGEEEQPPNPGKGKGKENVSNGKSSGSSDGMASKVMSSAAGLAKDLVFSGADSASTLHQAASSGKTSGLGTNGTTSNHISHETNGFLAGSSAQAGAPQVQDGFRSSVAPPGVQAEEFEQFSAIQASSILQETRSSSTTSWSQEFRQERGVLPTDFRAMHQLPDDGAEVAMLLSDPTFHAYEVDETHIPLEDPTEQTVDDLFGNYFSAEEQQAVTTMRSQLPPAPVHGVVSPHNPMNLVPHFEGLDLGPFPSADMQRFSQQKSDAVRNTLEGPRDGAQFQGASEREQFLSDWNDVLNGYTDEVWGGLLPVVKAAREQLEEMKSTESTEFEEKVVPRLRMILGHLHQTDILNKDLQTLGMGQGAQASRPIGQQPARRRSSVYKSNQFVEDDVMIFKETGHDVDLMGI